jgi:hypothetical protein
MFIWIVDTGATVPVQNTQNAGAKEFVIGDGAHYPVRMRWTTRDIYNRYRTQALCC